MAAKTHISPLPGAEPYTSGGLSQVWLVGLDRDGDDLIIPAFMQLHRAIAGALATLDRPLSGEEVRFLRTHCGWSRSGAAAALDVPEAAVVNKESGGSPAEWTAQVEAGLRAAVSGQTDVVTAAPLVLRFDSAARCWEVAPLRSITSVENTMK